jgi:transposase
VTIRLEDRFVSGLDHRLEPESEVRRFEVINGSLGRRRWTIDDRARILEETLAPGAVVSAVARRHGLTPQQLFTWRREARRKAEAGTLAFVPAVVAPEPAAAKHQKPSQKGRRPRRRTSAIELEAAGITVRIGDGVSPATIAAVIGALKGGT